MTSAVQFMFGKRGTGKSTLAKQQLRRARRLLVFDSLGEYEGYGQAIQDTATLVRVLLKFQARPFRLIFQPRELTQVRGTREIQEFTHFSKLATACYNTTVLVDEVHLVLNASMPCSAFGTLLRLSRHHNNTVIAVSQRPADVPRIVTSLATQLYVFRLHEPVDLKYMRAIIGPDAERVPDLPNFRYLRYDGESNTITEGAVSHR